MSAGITVHDRTIRLTPGRLGVITRGSVDYVAGIAQKRLRETIRQSSGKRWISTGNLAASWKTTKAQPAGNGFTATLYSELPYARIQDEGGTIYARGSVMAVPLQPMSFWTIPSLIGQMFPLRSAGGHLFLARKEGTEIVRYFILLRSVTIPAKHYVDEALAGIEHRMSLYIDRAVRAAGRA